MLVQQCSKTDMVNSFSFVSGHPLQDVIGTVNEANILSSSIKITPYAAFFRKSEEVKDQTQKEGIKELADLAISMISTLSPTFESWKDWLKRNEEIVNIFIKSASFNHEMGCDEIERTWIVGILCAISKYSPADVEQMSGEQKINRISWSNQVLLEIKATIAYEPFMTKRFEALWLGEQISANEISKDLEELLERARVFGTFDMVKEEGVRLQGYRTYNLISKHLLQNKLPEDGHEMLELVNDFRRLFKKHPISVWEKGYCEALFQHVLNHSVQSGKIIRILFQDYGLFRKEHFDLAKQYMLCYLAKESNFHTKNQHLKARYLEDIRGWTAQATAESSPPAACHLLEFFFKNLDSRKEDYLDHHKFIAAFFIVFPTQEKFFNDAIERGYRTVRHKVDSLIDMWSKVYPDGVIPEPTLDVLIFILSHKHPDSTWLEKVILHQIVNKLKISLGSGIVDLARVLEDKNWSLTAIGDEALFKYNKVIQHIQGAGDITSAEAVYELILRMMYHSIRFKIGCANAHVGKRRLSQGIREIILKAVEHYRRMRIVLPPVDRDIPISPPGLNTFVESVSNILDNHQLDQIAENTMIEQVIRHL
ncbi:uncharacterized protein MELLADRAFT_61669 [Melampsora larici-populina 98AG31]|uniref:Uncharacterized protein n=1 Tax=Melampsora larici-populina (strain 98AG31 / pathotype 3-4-7) TaxID=747676 RepID=F4RFV1_MELLP|nr:uncharacterized protein MELLADRAFT_61669 [Melampsora larici-populina 98AG31]EGG08729.1 hypothetical protein MELLADRAFT_61669 [Melampsora larici-populina 98AG31]